MSRGNVTQTTSARESMSRDTWRTSAADALEALAVEIRLNDPRSISARESMSRDAALESGQAAISARESMSRDVVLHELLAVAPDREQPQRAGAE